LDAQLFGSGADTGTGTAKAVPYAGFFMAAYARLFGAGTAEAVPYAVPCVGTYAGPCAGRNRQDACKDDGGQEPAHSGRR